MIGRGIQNYLRLALALAVLTGLHRLLILNLDVSYNFGSVYCWANKSGRSASGMVAAIPSGGYNRVNERLYLCALRVLARLCDQSAMDALTSCPTRHFLRRQY